MALLSMIFSNDWQEVSVLECVLGGMQIEVEVEPDPQRAWIKLAKSKIDALIVDCDSTGASGLLQRLQDEPRNSSPVLIASGSARREKLEAIGASFVVEKPVSVERAVHTLCAARNYILQGRLRYNRDSLDLPFTISCGSPPKPITASVHNLSQGGVKLHATQSLPVNEVVGLNIAVPGSESGVKMAGKVAWTDKYGNSGIRFVDISEDTQRQLQLWLERQYFRPSTATH